MKAIILYLKHRPAFSLALLAFFLFSFATAGTEISKLDIRFALLVQELDLAHPGVFPTLNHVSYPDYFLPWFLPAFLTTWGGRFITLWTLALPAILFGSLMTAWICMIGERVQKGVGIAAALLFLMTPEATYYICGFGMDVPLAFAGCLMLLAFQMDRRLGKNLLIFSVLLMFSTVIRGSLGVLVFGSAVGGYLLFRRQWKQVFIFGITGAAVAAVSVALILFLVYLQGGKTELQMLMDWQIHNRVKGGDFLYYFTDGMAALLPLSVFTVAGSIIGRKKILQSDLCGWLGWILCPMILLSIPGGKHLRYLLTLLPAMALIGGWGIVNWTGSFRDKLIRAGRYIEPVLYICGLTAAAVLLFLCLRFVSPAVTPVFPLSAAVAVFLLLGIFRKRILSMAGGTWIQIALILAAANILFAVPLTGLRESSRVFAEKVESGRKGNLFFFLIGPDHEDLKYYLFTTVEKRRKFRYIFAEPINSNLYTSKMYHTVSLDEIMPKITPDDVIIHKQEHSELLNILAAKKGFKAEFLHSGSLGHRTYYAVRLVPLK